MNWSTLESVGVRALNSLKVRTAVVGALAYVLVKLLHLGGDDANQIATAILQIVLVLIGAQGLADFGKESAKVTAVAGTAGPVAPAPPIVTSTTPS